MPLKRKAAATKTKGAKKAKTVKAAKGKKVKIAEPEVEEEEDAPVTTKKIIESLKKSDNKRKNPKVDAVCGLASSGKVLEDYDCMLNQTNIGHNNNKFYIIQVIEYGNRFYTWNRWGRVGETGANKLTGFGDKDAAIKDFTKKFQDKTKNSWDKRDSFQAKPGKYTLLEMGDDEDEEEEAAPAPGKKEDANVETLACTLDKSTQALINLIFDNDMFKEALQNLEIDVKKMPLGKISKSQIAKGFEVLEQIEEVLKKKKSGNLTELSSQFYTLIPHNFGRMRPTAISDEETLRKKMDLLTVLGDIEVTQAMQKEDAAAVKKDSKKAPHPLDAKYQMLKCGLKLVDMKSKVGKVIENYLNATKCQNLKILDVWEVDRELEGDRFATHDKMGNRKLLWHGTNVAVVAAILKSGLRIMPHSGGRVGKGIYFASENAKSAGYVSCARNIGIMFLNEVALGKEHHITVDDYSLTKPPSGYDCIIAKGQQEPDPTKDTTIEIDKHTVTVPQGKAIPQSKFAGSRFYNSEYLIYREDQCRIRYLLKIQF